MAKKAKNKKAVAADKSKMSDKEECAVSSGALCCPYTRSIVAGIAFTIISHLAGWLVWGKIYAGETTQYLHLWRDFQGDDVAKIGMPLASLLTGTLFGYIYWKLYAAVPGCSAGHKGLYFGFLVWLVAGLGCSVSYYTLTPISGNLLSASLLYEAGRFLIGGWLTGIVFGKLPECCPANSCSTKMCSKE